MYENPSNPYSVPENYQKPRKKRKAWLVVICIVLVAAIGIAAALALTKEARKYASAAAMYEMAQYETAAQLFAQIPGYRDADDRVLLSKYRMAEQLLERGEYQQAVSAFEALGDYEASEEKLLECYYRLGRQAQKQENPEQAIEYYTLAANYDDAAIRKQEAIYDWGHELFLEGEYERADELFARLEGNYPEDAHPHFTDLNAAAAYLKQQSDDLETSIICYIGKIPAEYADNDVLWAAVSNYVPLQLGSVIYNSNKQTLVIDATYYPGNRMVYAWRNGDDSLLSADEKQVLQLALELVEQAKAESETPLDVERWLYDWLCAHVTYENPDMDVEDEAYLQLRQLTCVGALLDGKANCQGYTDAFYLLGTLAGFDVSRIGGISEEPHSWNGIMLDGKMYIVDATFGDLEVEGDTAVNYVWFNCGYDPQYYEIDGGVQVLPALAQENDLSQSYYARHDTIFESLDEAAYYMLRQYKENGEGWVYAAIADTQISSEELFEALDDNMGKAGVWSIQWTEIIEYYGGNTYFAIRWE